MGLSNYPDGMRESDIPGWWDTECPVCDGSGEVDGEDPDDQGSIYCCGNCEGSGIVDSRSKYRYDDEPDDYFD